MNDLIIRRLWIGLGFLVWPLEMLAGTPLALWNFNGSLASEANSGVGKWQLVGPLIPALASGTGSSDPIVSGDQSLSLSGFPAVTNVTAVTGVEFSTRTKGFQNITFRFDLRATATACRHVRAWISSDGGVSFGEGPLFSSTKPGEFQNGWILPLDEAGATDQPDVRVRLLAETGEGNRWEGVSSNYSPAGTWRLDQAQFTGDPLIPVVVPPGVPAPVITYTNFITGRIHAGDPATNTFAELVLRPGQELRLVASVHDPRENRVQLAAASGVLPTDSAWTLPAQAASPALATFACRITEADAGREFKIGLEAENGSKTTYWWTVYVPSPAEEAISIGEFLADPPAGTPEFVELVHQGSARLDLSGWTLADATSIRHRFPSGSWCDMRGSLVIWGGSTSTTPSVPGVAFIKASSGGLSLNNSGDLLQIRNAHSNLIERVTYRGTDLGGGGSLTRSTFPDGPFQQHRTLSAEPWSPGRTVEGRPWPEVRISGDFPQSVRIQRNAAGNIRLEWEPIPGRLARIEKALDLDLPFWEVGRDVPDGEFVEDAGRLPAFYRVRWEP